jgi:hypothetical protein
MTYLFHEPVLGTPKGRSNALRPGVALTIAITGALLVTLGISKLPFVQSAASPQASHAVVVEQGR